MKTIVWFAFVLAALSAAGKVIISKPGQRATLECGVDAFTSSLRWLHGNDMIRGENFKARLPIKVSGTGNMVGRSKIRDGTNLEISTVKEEDAGQFICEADGRRQEHTLLVVSVSASPSADLRLGSEATLQCQVTGLDPVSTVQWKRPDGSSPSGSKAVQLKPVTRSDAGTWGCTFPHGGTTYNVSLAIKVQEPAPKTAAPPPSQTSGDVNKPTCPGCVTSPPANALLLGLSWWVWVAGGVGCLVVVLLVVFVIVLCKRIKRRKRKCRMMKNGQHPLKSKTYCQCDRPAAAKPRQGRRREKPSAPPLQPLLIQ